MPTTRPLRVRSRTAWIGMTSSALLLSACGSSLDVDLPPADPSLEEPAGLSWLARSALDVFLETSVLLGTDSGYVAMFARDGRVVHATTVGYADIEAEHPMQLDTRFRIASMTKPVTATAAMLLIEEGRLGLDDPVARYIPAAGELRVATRHERDSDGAIPTVPLSRPLLVRDLLTFSAGIGSRSDDSDLGRLWAERDIYAGEGTLQVRVNRILTAPLYEQPGQSWRYGWSADVLARVVEVAAGEPFGQLLERRIFEPLGMTATSHFGPDEPRDTLAKMYTLDENGDLTLVESTRSDALDWTPGGSGLVTTAGDYMRFGLMLWNGGTYDGVRILSPETVELMTRPHVASGVLVDEGMEGLGWGLGLAVVVDSDGTPTIDRDGDFWWSGVFSTMFVVSPDAGLVSVVLAQNLPSAYSGLPYAVFLAPAFAYWGL